MRVRHLSSILLALFVVATPALRGQDRIKSMPGYERYTAMAPKLAAAVRSGAVTAQWAEDGKSFEYLRDGKRWRFDAATRQVTEASASALVARAEQLGAARVVVANVGDADGKQLQALADRVRDGLGSGVAILGATKGDRAYLQVAVTKDLTSKVDAGQVVKEASLIIGGNGGGPASSARGGGKEPARLGDALDSAQQAVRARLSGGSGH